MNLVEYLQRQREFSFAVFGPNPRLRGVLDHLRKELVEVEAAPDDVLEFADVLILAFDAAMRAGHSPQAIAEALEDKLAINQQRSWPDWRDCSPDRAIEHVRRD
jgi:hypothetical protein